jgi:hypothetical protein
LNVLSQTIDDYTRPQAHGPASSLHNTITPAPATKLLGNRTYRDYSTASLLGEAEAWLWDLTEIDADPSSWSFPKESRAYAKWRLTEAITELERRDQLRSSSTAPRWPARFPDHRPKAATIKDALTVADYLTRRGVNLERAGDRLKARCPLPGHDDATPSFVVYPGERGWYCFGCHRGGDVFNLDMFLSGEADFGATVTALAAEAGVV